MGSDKIYFMEEDRFYWRKQISYKEDEELNRRRVEWAEAILKNVNLNRFQLSNDTQSSKFRLVISIIASNRAHHELLQVIAFLYKHLKTDYPLVICNAADEGVRTEDMKRFNANVIDMASYDGLNIGKDEIRFRKEAHDYWNCIDQTISIFNNTLPDYLLLIEDDAVPIPLFDLTIHSVIDQLERLKKIDYVKLYRRWPWRDWPTKYQLISDLHFLLTNKVMLAEVEGCCTPAVLYRVSRLPALLDVVKNFRNDTVPQKDLVLDAVTRKEGFVARQTDINLVVHIGFQSSLKNVYKNVGN